MQVPLLTFALLVNREVIRGDVTITATDTRRMVILYTGVVQNGIYFPLDQSGFFDAQGQRPREYLGTRFDYIEEDKNS